ncbi:TIGR03118 family protein [Ideonella azotifigens]|uniref:TIGR03118 family protein n=1 Tax=Ideonella azotifigens TaxID=513160 RepID=A0ABN1JQD2_9BURK|nr:TIGR03118 family protein [Ideonella azotifigens]MCD2340171.1 TIGR03118 family protein [Ideonella azotifigens]
MSLHSLRPVTMTALAALCTLALAGTAQAAGYAVHKLVSDGAVSTPHADAHLKNTWGVAFNPFGYVWVANNHDGSSTLYDGNGVPQSLVVSVPAASGSGIGSPTGIIYNGSSDFIVGNGTLTGASRFLFASEDGAITGWAPNVDQGHALIAVTKPGAIYKGIAQAATGTANQLYATDFHNNRVDVYDKAFAPVTTSGGFVDPALPKHYAPFGIQNINGNLYVSYARQDADAEDDVAGKGKGFVNVFNADGKLLRHLVAKEGLNAPWGMAMAPANFGELSNRLLVANFGDGTISAYDIATGAFIGQLSASSGQPLKIPGLWGIQFGNGLQSQPTNTLFFSAGPNDEADGVYGAITPK